MNEYELNIQRQSLKFSQSLQLEVIGVPGSTDSAPGTEIGVKNIFVEDLEV
jgi:hypothetical protein